ncbi:hypothetical protein HD554DRAFT_2107436 [Boletus coccyginus]|nr:hypothetical protein HD554DRAFT_2107436 [Boletus coccyginus]
MAEEDGFQYELVTYTMSSSQWKNVIFVDADQIVRAGLQELVDLDLYGAPHGYTPMRDDNYDMEGPRFWKTAIGMISWMLDHIISVRFKYVILIH